MKTYNVCDDGILREVADGDIGFWVKTIDCEAAIATKDARIAELELNAEGDANVKAQLAEMLGCADEPRWKWILLAVSKLVRGQATTPSEDGREETDNEQ